MRKEQVELWTVKQDYKAVFPKKIEPNTWYKVNINVSGTKASVTEGWILGQ